MEGKLPVCAKADSTYAKHKASSLSKRPNVHTLSVPGALVYVQTDEFVDAMTDFLCGVLARVSRYAMSRPESFISLRELFDIMKEDRRS